MDDITRFLTGKPIRLCSGTGSYESRTGCWMAAVNYISTGSLTWSDHPDCVCPTIRGLCIFINDMLPDDEARGQIIGPRLLDPIGSNAGPEIMIKRAMLAADRAARQYAPAALDAAGLHGQADALRSMNAIDSADTANAANAAARAAARAVANAAYAAVRAANAADAVRAANAAAHAADAVRAAAYAAAHAADAARADAKDLIAASSLMLLDDMLAIGSSTPIEAAGSVSVFEEVFCQG